MNRKIQLYIFSLILAILLIPTAANAERNCIDGDCENGEGKLVDTSGIVEKLEGTFKNGCIIEGTKYLPDGSKFEEGKFICVKLVAIEGHTQLLNFPDDTTDDVIERVIKREYGSRKWHAQKDSKLVEGVSYLNGEKWKEGKFKNGELVEGVLYDTIADNKDQKLSEGKFQDGLLVEGIYYMGGKKSLVGKFKGLDLIEGTKYNPDGSRRQEGKFKDWDLIEGFDYLSHKMTLRYTKGVGYEWLNLRWRYIGRSVVPAYWFIDTVTLKKEKSKPGKIAKANVWYKVVPDDDTNNETKENITVDCLNSTYSINGKASPDPIPPDSMYELIADVVCK